MRSRLIESRYLDIAAACSLSVQCNPPPSPLPRTLTYMQTLQHWVSSVYKFHGILGGGKETIKETKSPGHWSPWKNTRGVHTKHHLQMTNIFTLSATVGTTAERDKKKRLSQTQVGERERDLNSQYISFLPIWLIQSTHTFCKMFEAPTSSLSFVKTHSKNKKFRPGAPTVTFSSSSAARGPRFICHSSPTI